MVTLHGGCAMLEQNKVLVQEPLFLLACFGLALVAFMYALAALRRRADGLHPPLGRTGALLASCVPVLVCGLAAGYFCVKLLLG